MTNAAIATPSRTGQVNIAEVIPTTAVSRPPNNVVIVWIEE